MIARNNNPKATMISPKAHKLFLYSALFLAVAVLIIPVLTIGRGRSWEDEVFILSTGWSIVQTKIAHLSVLQLFPNTLSPVYFYGPVSFELSAFLIRLFGLSLFVWRLCCFFGVILVVFASANLVRRAGGDRWAQSLTILLLSMTGSVYILEMPGRFDVVAVGLFLCAVLFSVSMFDPVSRLSIWRTFGAGVCAGLALGSTPRVLTLALAAFAAVLVVILSFAKTSRKVVASALGISAITLMVHSALLRPWRLNSISWYIFVRHASALDGFNASPLTGPGVWNIQFQSHKSVSLLLLLLVIIGIWFYFKQRGSPGIDSFSFLQIRVFLTIFALANLTSMLLLLGNPLVKAPYWLPPIVIAVMSWFDSEGLRVGAWRFPIVGMVIVCLLLPLVQEIQQTAAIMLSWQRRNYADLSAFTRYTLPSDASVFGPIGGYFYPVALAGDRYLYPLEVTTPGLYSGPRAVLAQTLEKEICKHSSFVMWPKPGPLYGQDWSPMPPELQARTLAPLGEYHQPRLASWRDTVLRKLGPIGSKYGLEDVEVWPLRSLNGCRN